MTAPMPAAGRAMHPPSTAMIPAFDEVLAEVPLSAAVAPGAVPAGRSRPMEPLFPAVVEVSEPGLAIPGPEVEVVEVVDERAVVATGSVGVGGVTATAATTTVPCSAEWTRQWAPNVPPEASGRE